MDRRKFLAVGGALGASSLAGCFGLFGSERLPPPRRSDVFERIKVSSTAITVPLEEQPEAEAAVTSNGNAVDAPDVGSLAPVGVARAAKGRGAVGRGTGGSYSSAPRGAHGRAIWHGDEDNDDWRDNHQDQFKKYQAAVPTVAFAHLGPLSLTGDDLPGAGPPSEWDQTIKNPDGTVRWQRDNEEGWFRVGAKLEAENADRSLGWSAVDFQIKADGSNYEIGEKWKVEPRLNTSN